MGTTARNVSLNRTRLRRKTKGSAWPTGIRYPFASGEIRYVDSRDAEPWLNPPKGDGKAFEEVKR